MRKILNYTLLILATIVIMSETSPLMAQANDRQKAEKMIRRGEYMSALAVYEQIDAKESTLESVRDLAKIHHLLLNFPQVEEYYRKAITMPGAPVTLYLDLGDILIRNGKYQEARQMYFTYSTRGGTAMVAKQKLAMCDSVDAILARKPLYGVYSESRLNSKFVDLSAIPTPNGKFVVVTSDRPLDMDISAQDELYAVLALMPRAQGEDSLKRDQLIKTAYSNEYADFTKFSTSNPSVASQPVYKYTDGATPPGSKKRTAKPVEEKEKPKKGKDEPQPSKLSMYLAENRGSIGFEKDNLALGSYAWTRLIPLPEEFNSGRQAGPCTFTPDGNTMYFCSSEILAPDALKSSLLTHVGLYISEKTSQGWTEPVPFKYNNQRTYSIQHPCLSPDGKTLYFASDMPGSLGGLDLFKCDLYADGTWGQPKNLGNVINTPQNEVFPTIGTDSVFYFASDGHPSLGGLDIFRAKGPFGSWKSVENLGKPINSNADDFSFVMVSGEKGRGLFASNRIGGMGEDDIYSFRLLPPPAPVLPPKPTVMPIAKNNSCLVVTVINKKDNKPIAGVHMTLINVKAQKGSLLMSDDQGNAKFEVTPQTIYKLTTQVPGYMPAGIEGINTKNLKKGDCMNVSLALEEIQEGSGFEVENVYYDVGKATLKTPGKKELDKVVDFLKLNPDLKVELSSHTDKTGSAQQNMILSQQRAESCVNYLVENGIDRKRLVPKGYGSKKPVVDKPRMTPRDHAKNRRTEIKILSKN